MDSAGIASEVHHAYSEKVFSACLIGIDTLSGQSDVVLSNPGNPIAQLFGLDPYSLETPERGWYRCLL